MPRRYIERWHPITETHGYIFIGKVSIVQNSSQPHHRCTGEWAAAVHGSIQVRPCYFIG